MSLPDKGAFCPLKVRFFIQFLAIFTNFKTIYSTIMAHAFKLHSSLEFLKKKNAESTICTCAYMLCTSDMLMSLLRHESCTITRYPNIDFSSLSNLSITIYSDLHRPVVHDVKSLILDYIFISRHY